MARSVFVYREGLGVIPKQDAPPLGSGPAVIRDAMNELRHPATGQMMDSKSEFRRVTKDHGLIEVGNESSTPPRRHVDNTLAHDVVSALQKVREGYKPNPALVHAIRGDGWE